MNDRQEGFALLIVLLTMGFLALVGTQLVAAARSDTKLTENLKQAAILEAAADGAVAHALFAIQAAHDPDLRADGVARILRIGQTAVSIRVWNENDRVNPNIASTVLLRYLIVQAGTPPALADRLAADMVDWRTAGSNLRDGEAKAVRYRAAGLSYAPPGTPFQTVQEVTDVLGMTPELFKRLAPHLTVLTDTDPDLTTSDPVVRQALTDASGIADDAQTTPTITDPVVRIEATSIGKDGGRFRLLVVASTDFQAADPHVNILLREHLLAIDGNAAE
jgi:general secretion pathway protein K